MTQSRKKPSPPPSVDWSRIYKDEVEAAEDGILFQPGYVPQRGKPLTGVIDLDPPGQPHWLSGMAKNHKR